MRGITIFKAQMVNLYIEITKMAKVPTHRNDHRVSLVRTNQEVADFCHYRWPSKSVKYHTRGFALVVTCFKLRQGQIRTLLLAAKPPKLTFI